VSHGITSYEPSDSGETIRQTLNEAEHRRGCLQRLGHETREECGWHLVSET